MSIAVYLSAAFTRHPEVNLYAHELRRDGLTVVSIWHRDATSANDAGLTNEQRTAEALKDLDDLERANCLVLMGDAPGEYAGSGGKWCEFGYALNMGIHIVVIGHREGVFTHLPGVVFAPDADSARVYLRDLKVAKMRRAA